MNIRPLTREEVRGIDQTAANKCGIPTLILMENAGTGAAHWLRDQLPEPSSRVLILCGPGNNGGDGGVVARHLDAWGFSNHVVWFAQPDQLRGDAAVQWAILAKSAIDQVAYTSPHDTSAARLDALLADADWVVDALLGTGLTRPVEGVLHSVIEAINRSGKPVLALDLPSGLDADTGQPQGIAVRASATVTFVSYKIGFNVPGAAEYTGTVVVVDIGVPRCILEPYMDPRSRSEVCSRI